MEDRERQTETIPSFLRGMFMELENWDAEMFAPPWKPELGEVVLGIASSYACKLFSISRHFGREAERQEVELRYTPHGEPYDAAYAHLDELRAKERICLGIFFACCADQFNAWGKPLGIRRGWHVVIRMPKKPPQHVVEVTGFMMPPEQ
jgi:hypothetical protein